MAGSKAPRKEQAITASGGMRVCGRSRAIRKASKVSSKRAREKRKLNTLLYSLFRTAKVQNRRRTRKMWREPSVGKK